MSQKSILAWLASRGIETRPADPKIIAEYERQMREETIPKIIEAQRANERRVAGIRHKVLF